MGLIAYATREDVKSALDSAETARNNAKVDRALGAAKDTIDGFLKRSFRPVLATRTKSWPNRQYARPWRLWLDRHELISIDTLTAGGITIPAADYFLEPQSGPPFNRIEIDLDSSSAFAAGDTHQRAVSILGLFGHSNNEESVGSLSASLAAGASSTSSVTWTTANVGVGDVLRIDDERVIVSGRTMVDSTQDIGGNLTASTSDVSISVTNGAGFDTDEIILVDSERMLVVDIAGNTLTVKRAWDGSVLASHTSGADIYTLTGVQLSRGELGTTDASHSSGATIYRHLVPPLIRDLSIGEALVQLQQEGAGYARQSGSGDNEMLVNGRGLTDIRRDALYRYGRRSRTRGV